MQEVSLSGYMYSPFVWADWLGLVLTLLVVIVKLSEWDAISIETLRLIAAITSSMLFMKVYGWLRLFDTTSFYAELVGETMNGIGPIMILYALALLTFGFPISMINLSRSDSADSTLVSTYLGSQLVDALLNQYMLSLGEFGGLMDNSSQG